MTAVQLLNALFNAGFVIAVGATVAVSLAVVLQLVNIVAVRQPACRQPRAHCHELTVSDP